MVIVMALGILQKTHEQYRSQRIARYWFLVVSCLWIAIAFAAIFPSWSDVLARAVGIGRGVDLFVYSAVLVLLYAVYRLFVRTQEMEREITDLVRALALRDGDGGVR